MKIPVFVTTVKTKLKQIDKQPAIVGYMTVEFVIDPATMKKLPELVSLQKQEAEMEITARQLDFGDPQTVTLTGAGKKVTLGRGSDAVS